MTDFDLIPYIGKGVEVVLTPNAVYRGTLQRVGRLPNGDPKFALVRVTIINKLGGHTTPKYGETRKLSVTRIKSITFCSDVSLPRDLTKSRKGAYHDLR